MFKSALATRLVNTGRVINMILGYDKQKVIVATPVNRMMKEV